MTKLDVTEEILKENTQKDELFHCIVESIALLAIKCKSEDELKSLDHDLHSCIQRLVDLRLLQMTEDVPVSEYTS